MLNALYGKMLMRPVFTQTAIVSNIQEFNKFCEEFDLTDFTILSPNRLLLTGETTDDNKELKITKPSQMGAFVLAYSRRIMLTYFKACDPTLQRPVFYYTDTDSLEINAQDYITLKNKGMIKLKKNAALGYLCSDIKNEGVIVAGKYFGPKCYGYEYITSKNEVYCNDSSTMKTKGIPTRKLTYDMFDKGVPHKVDFDGLKKIDSKVTSKEKAKGLECFSICKSETTRTWNKSKWSGMELIGNDYVPYGYDETLRQAMIEAAR